MWEATIEDIYSFFFFSLNIYALFWDVSSLHYAFTYLFIIPWEEIVDELNPNLKLKDYWGVCERLLLKIFTPYYLFIFAEYLLLILRCVILTFVYIVKV